MDSEPVEGQEKRSVPSQEVLRSIFDMIGQLSGKGEETFSGRVLAKTYPLDQTAGQGNLTEIFVGQRTEKGRREIPTTQDRDVVLKYKNGEVEQVDYRLYKDDENYRIEKEEGFKREGDQPVVENIFQALEGAERAREGRDLEKKLGYTNVHAEEANQLRETLSKLVGQEGL